MDWRFIKRRFWLGLILVSLLVFILIKLSGRQPVAVIASVEPKRENLSASISSNGKVEPITPYEISARLQTFVEKVYAVEGQQVKKGQLLLTLNVTDARAQLASARVQLLTAQDALRAANAGGRPDDAARIAGDLAKAQAERDRLKKDHDALGRLAAEQAATKEDLAQNELALGKSEAELSRARAAKEEFDRRAKLSAEEAKLKADQAEHEVESLEEKVRSAEARAPMDGTLYSLPTRAGAFVTVGQLLAEMADLHKVRVRAFIDEPELGALEPNQSVLITWDALPNRTWQGKTEVIPKQVVPHNTRSVGEVLCSVNNDKLELLPNINVNVRINSRERIGVLSISRGAVQIDGTHRYVYVITDGTLGVNQTRLEKREIRVGIASATDYEILSGLIEGDKVALPGDVELKDGMAVRVVQNQ
ncbi:MAG TPA: efflux RND transporter periplasmic adaptor subunit [Candidatus Acidoferrales bacterium]|nr:efflux RND transporter periplasmic adaptor subunit [Candidatus Acidoferrales bacterium]